MTRENVIETSLKYFADGYACSQSVLLAFSDQFNLDETTAKLISSTFGGGMGRLRQKCGAVTGGFMVLGLAFGNTNPQDMETKLYSYKKVRELNSLVELKYGTSNCFELLKKHATEADIEDRKHHKIICRKIISDTTGIIYDIISSEK